MQFAVGATEYVLRYIDANREYVLAEPLPNEINLEDDVGSDDDAELERMDYQEAREHVKLYYHLN